MPVKISKYTMASWHVTSSTALIGRYFNYYTYSIPPQYLILFLVDSRTCDIRNPKVSFSFSFSGTGLSFGIVGKRQMGMEVGHGVRCTMYQGCHQDVSGTCTDVYIRSISTNDVYLEFHSTQKPLKLGL